MSEHQNNRATAGPAAPARVSGREFSTFRLAWELVRYRPGLFAICFAVWTSVHAMPLIFGLLVARIFERLAGDEAAISSAWTWVAVFLFFAVGRNGVIWFGDVRFITFFMDQSLQIRRNLLRWLLEADGSRVLTAAPGEALSTFRDDVEDLLEYLENYIDGGGIALFSIGSVIVMASVDPVLTAGLLVPLLLVVFVAQALGPEIRNRRRAMRRATEDVTGLVGETFAAVQAVKLGSATEPVMAELRRRNEVRRKAALRDTFLTEALLSLNLNMSTVTIAFVLLVTANGLANGTVSIGELVIFLSYLPRLTFYLAFIGHFIAQHRRTGVAFERIRRLAVDAPDEELLDRTRVPLDGELGELPPRVRTAEDRLQKLEVTGLSFAYPTTLDLTALDLADGGRAGVGGGAIVDVSFTLERGSFTVIAGRVGAGKSTIVRAMLGLLPADGEVRWNDRLINDRASFLVPPRSAYTPQIPRLFSDTLAYNIALQEGSQDDSVRSAARLAVLDTDLDRLARGIETVVGARGVKLSGGQIQRSAVARMFATEADLLVFDDLSSALDLHTEAELWDRLFDHRQATCLVVSHRPAALERADQILVVDDGRIVDRGPLAELLERSEVMAELWDVGTVVSGEPTDHR
jgi:ATP-binding cassette subfamily B protein/ATP-binding cassette subfamily C protein